VWRNAAAAHRLARKPQKNVSNETNIYEKRPGKETHILVTLKGDVLALGMYVYLCTCLHMGWLRIVGSINFQVSSAKKPFFCGAFFFK